MKFFLEIFLVFVCIAVISTTGCTGPPELPVVVPSPGTITAIPTTAITTVTPTSEILTKIPSEIKITSPNPDATDVSKIQFLHYSDHDFSVDYPPGWIITKSAYTPYYCKNNLETDSAVYFVCYQNETKSTGPFNFYDDSTLKKQRRIVTFTSADGTLKFVSFTSDFVDNLNGNVMLNPSMEWCKAQFEYNYPELTGYASKFVGNYNFFTAGNTKTSTYDVILPKGAPYYYPSAYTKKSVVTMHHLYSFGFTTDIENFYKYQNLREYMLASITTNDNA